MPAPAPAARSQIPRLQRTGHALTTWHTPHIPSMTQTPTSGPPSLRTLDKRFAGSPGSAATRPPAPVPPHRTAPALAGGYTDSPHDARLRYGGHTQDQQDIRSSSVRSRAVST